VLREACAQARRWQDAGIKDLVVAVNLSSVQFRRDDFEQEVVQALAEARIAPACIELELTESLLIAESQPLTALLGRFRAMGLRLTIDDFGTGYSNLGYLKRFNVERLKIDQSFIRRLLRDASDESIVRAIIEMSHSLKIDVIAEGIEDAQTLQRLVDLGCDFGQGFFWAPALPANEFAEFVSEHQFS
jgi:EAL domain-containing protein (putative c-di-GMP-specific phosphodiesterase class I)